MSRSLTPQKRRAQGGHQGDAVGGIVQRAQDGQDLVHLLAVEEGLAALDGEAQARRLQRLLERTHLGEPPGQDHDVARPAGTLRPGLRDRAPRSAPAATWARKAASARASARSRSSPVREGRFEAQRDHRRVLAEAGRRRDRLVGGLAGLVRGA